MYLKQTSLETFRGRMDGIKGAKKEFSSPLMTDHTTLFVDFDMGTIVLY